MHEFDSLLTIANKTFSSRLLMGSARYPDPSTMLRSIEASGTEIVTVSMRRFNGINSHMQLAIEQLKNNEIQILPNTAGCHTCKEAVLTANLAREALGTTWIKLEIIGDENTLMPDVVELLKAAETLIQEGFTVLAYCNDDPITCRKLADRGCAAVMPLGSPIGSGMGILNPYNIQMIRQQIDIPLILDAGIGTASDAALAMELGCDAVLINTAVAQAVNPISMSLAMKFACQAGRLSYLSGRIPKKLYATASSPVEGVVRS